MSSLRVNLTRRCNRNCPYCYMKRNNEDINLKLLVDYIVHSKIHNISLSGGEPLLYDSFDSLMDELYREKVKIHIVSNGDLIQQKEILLKNMLNKSMDFYFSISIDETGKCNYKAVNKLDEMGIKTSIFLYPFTNINNISGKDILFHNSREIILLFPVSMGNNNNLEITPNEWIKKLYYWKDFFSNRQVKLYAQTAFKVVELHFGENKIKQYDCSEGKFMDCNGDLFDCCLLAESFYCSSQIYFCNPDACPILRNYRRHGYRTTCPFNLVFLNS